MPTLPNTFTAGTVTNANKVAENIFNPKDPPVSFDAINGYLGDDNIQDQNVINFDSITPREVTNAREVGATINVDYFSSYSFVNTALSEITDNDIYMSIPGLSISYYVPFEPAALLFTWSLTYVWLGATRCPPNSLPSEDQARFRFFIDETYQTGQQLRIGLWFDDIYGSSPPASPSAPVHKNVDAPPGGSNVWNGHYLASGSAKSVGWHTASIKLAMSNDSALILPCNHMRIFCRSLRVIALR